MRGWITLLALLAVATLPGAALAAAPAPGPAWPSAHDIQKEEPGVRASDAVCVARYYRGRLSRTAWFTPYYGLTVAEKLATDAGRVHCMTLAERIAENERSYTKQVGKDSSEVHCVAVRVEAFSRARRLAEASRAAWVRDFDGISRSCGLTGMLYAKVATAAHLPLVHAEGACLNRVGSTDPIMHAPPKMKAVGATFDRCVGAASERAMYRFALTHAKLGAALVPCVAQRAAASLTFAEMFSKAASVKTKMQSAVAGCLAAG